MEYARRGRTLCISKFNVRNLVSGKNTWVVGVVRYLTAIVEWTKENIVSLNQLIPELVTINRCLNPWSNMASLYLPRKWGDKCLILRNIRMDSKRCIE